MIRSFSKFGDLFKSSFDIYGEAIVFEIRGQSNFTTYIGALISLAILVVTISYAYMRFGAMRDYQDTSHLQILEPTVNAEKVFS